ncbi:MAG: superinfection exclusion B family protein [Methylomicrobium sp.]
MPSIEQIIQALKLAPRYLIAISIFSGILIFASDKTAKLLGIYQFTQDYHQWIGITFIATISLIAIDWGIKISAVVRNMVRSVKFKKRIIQCLHTLTEEEKQILRYYLAKQSKTNTLRTDDGIVNTLVAKGIIYRSANHGNLLEGFSHNINELAWDYLNINHGLLDGTTNTYRTDKRNYFG